MRARPWLLAALLSCLILDFCFARSIMPNSDTRQVYNELPAIEAGNILLRHWILTSDNFYLTDLPFFVLFRFLLGDTPRLVFLVPLFVFFLFLVACLLLVRDDRHARSGGDAGRFAVLFLLGLPFARMLEPFLLAAVHVATITFCLYALLIVRPILSGPPFSDQPFDRRRLLAFTGLVLAAAASDPLTDVIFIGPLLLLLLIRAWLRSAFRLDEALLAVCLVAGAVGGVAVVHVIAAAGGFTTNPSFTTKFVGSADDLGFNMTGIRGAIEVLFSARAALLHQVFAHQVVAFTRLLAAICVIMLCVRVFWRMPRVPRDGVPQCLVLSSACLLVLDLMSGNFAAAVSDGATFPTAAARYVLPAYMFGSIAAAIEFRPCTRVYDTTASGDWLRRSALRSRCLSSPPPCR